MAVLADLLIRMGVDSAEVRKGLKTVQSELHKFTRDVGAMRSTLEGAFAAVGIGAAAQRLAGFVRSGAEAADRLGELAQSAGMAAGAFSRLSYAAQFSGVDAEHLSHMFGFMSKSMGEAAMGAGHGADAFKLLGVQVADADGRLRNSKDVLLEIADRFAGMEDGAAKTAIALGIFGKKGADIIPVLNRGATALEGAADEGERLGEVMSADVLAGADKYADALKRIESLSTTLGATIASQLAPALEHLAASFVETADKAGGARTAAQDIALALKMLGSAAIATWGVIQTGAAHAAAPLAALALAVQGQFAAAGQALRNWGGSVEDEWARMKERLDALWSPGLTGKLSRVQKPAPAFSMEGHGGKKGKDPALEALAEQMKDFNRLVDEAEKVMDAVATPTEKYFDTLRDLDRLLAEGAIDQDTYSRAAKKAGDDYFETSGGLERLKDEMEAFNRTVADAERVMDDVASPLEKYREEMERLNELLRAGAISQAQFDAAADQAAITLARSNVVISGMADAGVDAYRSIVDAARNSTNVLDALWQSLLRSFQNIVDQMVAKWIESQILMAGANILTGGVGGTVVGGVLGGGGGAGVDPFASVSLAQTAAVVPTGSTSQALTAGDGGGAVRVTNVIQAWDGRDTRRALDRSSREVARSYRRAMRRNQA